MFMDNLADVRWQMADVANSEWNNKIAVSPLPALRFHHRLRA
jgi:hypothetical protein